MPLFQIMSLGTNSMKVTDYVLGISKKVKRRELCSEREKKAQWRSINVKSEQQIFVSEKGPDFLTPI